MPNGNGIQVTKDGTFFTEEGPIPVKEYSIYVPMEWCSGEPGEPHSAKIQRVIDAHKPDAFIDYGQCVTIESSDDETDAEFAELAFREVR